MSAAETSRPRGDGEEQVVRAVLRERGCEWPAPLEWHASLGSTNDLLRERAREGAPAWTAVAAGRQTAGRGRQGRSWVSEPGNLFLSVLFRPQAWPAESVAVLPLLAGVAVAEAARAWGVNARLKWPNDVVVGDHLKLAGILAEGSSTGGALEYVVVGIGVNLCFDPIGEPLAISVRGAGGKCAGPPHAAAGVLEALQRTAHHLLPRGAAGVVAAWREHAVDWWGRPVQVVSEGSRVAGEAVGVDDRGALLLRTDRGTMRLVSGTAQELRLLPARPPEEGS